MKALLLITVAACASKPDRTTFVADARIEHGNLVVFRCEVRAQGDQLKREQCAATQQPLPYDNRRPLPSRLTEDQIARGMTPPLREALVQCARQVSLAGSLKVQLTVSAVGEVEKISSSDPALTPCASEGAMRALRRR